MTVTVILVESKANCESLMKLLFPGQEYGCA